MAERRAESMSEAVEAADGAGRRLTIVGRLVEPDGSGAVDVALALTWGDHATAGRTGEGGRFALTVPVGKSSAPPANTALSADGEPLLVAMGLAVSTPEGERRDVGTVVRQSGGLALLSPAGTWYGVPQELVGGVVLQEPSALGKVLSDAGSQLDSASKDLAPTSYSLGAVQLTVKGAMTNDGLSFLDAGGITRVDPGHLTAIAATYTPDEPPPRQPVRGGGPKDGTKVPDLGGYTRALAHRKLAAMGLVPEFSVQTVVAGERRTMIGRVVRQAPEAGDHVPPGSAVRLFLGKAAPPAPNVRRRRR